jgi:hypothetical protein
MTDKRIWRIWKGMIERCSNPKAKDRINYVNRGISVCKRWQGSTGFANFLKDMGDPGEDSKLTLDRIDNDKGYSKANCRWATWSMQHRNRRSNRHITAGGKTQTLVAWAEQTGIKRSTITKRIDKYGWSPADAVTVPPNSRGF